MKTILLLGFNDLVVEYAKDVLRVENIAYYPSITTHFTELKKYVGIALEDKPQVITTQSNELIDVFLQSELDFEIVTVRKCAGKLRTRTLTKEAALDLREKYDCELRC